MSTKKMKNLIDVIELDYLQKIQDSLGSLLGVTVSLIDPDGNTISQPSKITTLCESVQKSPGGHSLCTQCHKEMFEENVRRQGPLITTCPNTGLRAVSVPIVFKDGYLGSWLISQIRMGDINETLLEETAQRTGVPEDSLKEAAAALPLTTEEGFSKILDFLMKITEVLTDLVAANLSLEDHAVELQNLANMLDASSQRFREFIDLADIAAYLIDYETAELIMYNDMYSKLVLQGTGKDLEGTPCYKLLGFDTFCPFCPKGHLVDENNEPTGPYVWENHIEEHDIWISITSRALRWVDGRLAIMTTFMDITNQKNEEQRMAHLAYNDQRLNIPNGVKLFEDLKSTSDTGYLICLDVQGLRKINDVYGRESGDKLLQGIVTWFQSLPIKELQLYCVEGDDFVIFLPNRSKEEAMTLAADLHERFELPWNIELNDITRSIYVGAHVGVLDSNRPFESHSTLLNIIQRALGFARKEDGIIFFDEEKNSTLAQQIKLEIELKSCILNNMEGFSLNYQPLVDVVSGKWAGLEALCRWTSPKLGFVPPDVFIGAAEQLGLISILSDWVLEEAISQVKKWGLHELPSFTLDVNLSPLQLRDKELVDRVVETIKKYEYPPEKLSLEITESAEIHFNEGALDLLKKLRSHGISLALDDFGSGYASLSNLNKIPVTSVKIDRSLVTDIEKDPFLQQTVRSVVDLAQVSKLITVAEGVETEGQRKFVTSLGVSQIQGFYFSMPLSEEALTPQIGNFKR